MPFFIHPGKNSHDRESESNNKERIKGLETLPEQLNSDAPKAVSHLPRSAVGSNPVRKNKAKRRDNDE